MDNNIIRRYLLNSRYFLFISLLLTVFIYLPGLNGPFLLDDYSSTLQLKQTELNWQKLLPLSFSQNTGPIPRAFANASFSLNYIFFGEETFSFKVTNLILHLITGFLFFILGKKILSHCLKNRPYEKYATPIALLCAAIWLVHPLHVSTVLYVVQRMAQLSALFTLLAILAYFTGRERLLQGKSYAYTIMLSGYFIAGLFGALSKETIVLLPGYLLLIEMFVFKFETPIAQKGIRDKRFFITFGILVVIPVVVGLCFFLLKSDSLLSGYMNRSFTLGERLLTESHILWDYIRQYFMPQLSAMALHHDGYPVVSSAGITTIIAITGLLVMLGSGLLLRKVEPVIALGLLWFLLSHSLESTIFPLELKFEHRNYMAMYGLLLAAVYSLFRFTACTRYLQYSKVFIALFIILLSYQTFARSSIWADQETLFSTEAHYQPDSYRLIHARVNINLKNGDLVSARKMNASLRSTFPSDASPAIHDIILDCAEVIYSSGSKTHNSTQYITEALSLIKNTREPGDMPYIYFTYNSLVDLSRIVASGRCKNITNKQLIIMLNTVLENPLLAQRPEHKQKLAVQLARIHYKSGNILLATSILEEAHQLKPSILNTLLEKGFMELNTGNIKSARKTVESLIALNKTLPFYRKYTSQITELESFIKQEETHSQ